MNALGNVLCLDAPWEELKDSGLQTTAENNPKENPANPVSLRAWFQSPYRYQHLGYSSSVNKMV